MQEKVTICPVCGNEQIEWNYRFCPVCGTEVKEKALTEAATSDVSAREINQVQDILESGLCQDSLLNEMIRVRELFKMLYGKTGLISVESMLGIHLDEDFFLKTFSEYRVSRRVGEYPYELAADYGGVKFFCITTELQEVRNNVV